jgi:hypothetical protein
MTDSPKGYNEPAFYIWSPSQCASARYFVRPAPAVNDPDGRFLAFYETPEAEDWVALVERRFADLFLAKAIADRFLPEHDGGES